MINTYAVAKTHGGVAVDNKGIADSEKWSGS